jgi:hypothetical protein
MLSVEGMHTRNTRVLGWGLVCGGGGTLFSPKRIQGCFNKRQTSIAVTGVEQDPRRREEARR